MVGTAAWPQSSSIPNRIRWVSHPVREPRLARRHHLLIALVLFAGLGSVESPAAEPVRFDFEQRYFLDPGRIASDHTLVFHDGRYHLFFTVGNQGEGWMMPGNMIDFGHATSTDLIHWEIEEPVLTILPDTWRNRNLWAPHIERGPDGVFQLYYTGVDSTIVQQSGLATSTDLYNWVDADPDSVYHPNPSWAAWQYGTWSNGRDPFVFQLDNVYAMLTTASIRPEYLGLGNRGAISMSFSIDGEHFTDAGAPMFINDTYLVLESTHMFRQGPLYYLFYHEQNVPGVRYMTSATPFEGWNKNTAQVLEAEAFAPEIVQGERDLLYTRVKDAMWKEQSILGVKIDPIRWNGITPQIGRQNRMFDDWVVVWGDAFQYQPTFGDRAADHTGMATNIEGLFSINTSEKHAGPLSWGCPECHPDPVPTGVLRSRAFRLTQPTISLRVGGGQNPDSTYVILRAFPSGVELQRATGRGSDFLFPVAWDVSPYVFDWVYLEIVDLARTGLFGHVSVDLIEETEAPPVAGAPESAPGARLSLVRVGPTPSPGPFRFQFQLSGPSRLRLTVHDVLGRRVTERDLGPWPAGSGRVDWEARDANGEVLPAGIYFYRLADGDRAASRGKLVLVP